MKRGRYYLGRVVKINLTQDDLMNAMANASEVPVGRFFWTITDVVDCRAGDNPYFFGRLSKYSKDGRAKVIDEGERSQVETEVPNLLEASSPFVYLPDLSGLAFLHVWNGIQEDVFPRRFKSVIEATIDGLLVSCDVEPISDYRAFVSRLRRLEKITEISATVYPPNPLFGRLWVSLNDYVKERSASEVTIKEQSVKEGGLASKIVSLVTRMVRSPKFEPKEAPAIGDAAILMAADGYGRGTVVGVEDGENVIIKTSDTQKNFLYDKDATPEALANKARFNFERVSIERDMSH